MCALVKGNREYPYEIPQNGVFHMGLYCLLKQNNPQGLQFILIFGNSNLPPLYRYNKPSQVYYFQTRWKKSLVFKWL